MGCQRITAGLSKACPSNLLRTRPEALLHPDDVFFKWHLMAVQPEVHQVRAPLQISLYTVPAALTPFADGTAHVVMQRVTYCVATTRDTCCADWRRYLG
jgi:hypothetical protein